MGTGELLSLLLGAAVLFPLASFVMILLAGPYMGARGKLAGRLATLCILCSCVLSMISLVTWLRAHPPVAMGHHAEHHGDEHHGDEHHGDEHHGDEHAVLSSTATQFTAEGGHSGDAEHGDDHGHGTHGDSQSADAVSHGEAPYYYREVYTLAKFYGAELSISVYIDALTVAMFAMVTLIASCIHFYATGYMHDELVDDYVDHEAYLSDGSHVHRPGRYHRFFQALSLFCFSMLGLVLSGNIAMTFVFWELVGICSYFLIGFYVERHSASTAANKAFIVNRVGDFGMIIGLMAIWGSLGTFAFGGPDGIFAQVRPGSSHELIVPDGMVKAAAGDQVSDLVAGLGPDASAEEIDTAIAAGVPHWREQMESGQPGRSARWLLIIAGVGIFCGCVGKSAQFPLHTWLPDAMEGPTPVSALVHSATMVAAGVFLVARFYPVFCPEVLFVIALVGTLTLFMAATIAIVATDIKRVLAYSTVSQLGYMMLALGVGGWLAGVLHLFTHAFFKSLLFMCSGSVIHAVHTNEMSEMGGLRKKMPWTSSTMLIGCLAIAGAGFPFAVSLFGLQVGALGFSGFHSKDATLEMALLFNNTNPGWGTFFFVAAAAGAGITAFYMFRLWYLTFAGEPRNQERYDHAHESPPVMYRPLILLATLAIAVAWGPVQAIAGSILAVLIFVAIKFATGRGGTASHDQHDAHSHEHGPGGRSPLTSAIGIALVVLFVGLVWTFAPNITLGNLLEQARPMGTLPAEDAVFMEMTWPNEHDSHVDAIRVPATWIAFSTAFAGFFLATLFYGLRKLDAAEAQRTFSPLHRFLLNKWWFDELYDFVFVRPAHIVSNWISNLDRRLIDGLIDSLAWIVRGFATVWERVADRVIVDGSVNLLADRIYAAGVSLRRLQTGSLRQYVMFIVVGTVVLFALSSIIRHALAY